MKTPKSKRLREAARKAERKRVHKPKLQRMKQELYFNRTARWEQDPTRLHWHHTDPLQKTRKVCHLATRSWGRIEEEIKYCVVLHKNEHFELHGHNLSK